MEKLAEIETAELVTAVSKYRVQIVVFHGEQLFSGAGLSIIEVWSLWTGRGSSTHPREYYSLTVLYKNAVEAEEAKTLAITEDDVEWDVEIESIIHEIAS